MCLSAMYESYSSLAPRHRRQLRVAMRLTLCTALASLLFASYSLLIVPHLDWASGGRRHSWLMACSAILRALAGDKHISIRPGWETEPLVRAEQCATEAWKHWPYDICRLPSDNATAVRKFTTLEWMQDEYGWDTSATFVITLALAGLVWTAATLATRCAGREWRRMYARKSLQTDFDQISIFIASEPAVIVTDKYMHTPLVRTLHDNFPSFFRVSRETVDGVTVDGLRFLDTHLSVSWLSAQLFAVGRSMHTVGSETVLAKAIANMDRDTTCASCQSRHFQFVVQVEDTPDSYEYGCLCCYLRHWKNGHIYGLTLSRKKIKHVYHRGFTQPHTDRSVEGEIGQWSERLTDNRLEKFPLLC